MLLSVCCCSLASLVMLNLKGASTYISLTRIVSVRMHSVSTSSRGYVFLGKEIFTETAGNAGN